MSGITFHSLRNKCIHISEPQFFSHFIHIIIQTKTQHKDKRALCQGWNIKTVVMAMLMSEQRCISTNYKIEFVIVGTNQTVVKTLIIYASLIIMYALLKHIMFGRFGFRNVWG